MHFGLLVHKDRDLLIGNFEIKEIIGRGAFGIVFSAYEKNSKQFVAIKKVLFKINI